MAAPTLAIGVGGTGARVLLRVKERLLEAYDQVPDDFILYELDTDDYRDTRDSFNGVRLQVEGDKVPGQSNVGSSQAEFYHVATRDRNTTLDNIFEYKREHKAEWQWVNEGRMYSTLTSHDDFVIKVGARTVRPIGRSALFLNYNEVYSNLRERLRRVAGKQREWQQAGTHDSNIQDDNKATVFVVASVAGGSGAGMVLDILRMIEHMRSDEASDLRAAPISVMALLVGGAAFTGKRGERTDSNTFAALRELDRLGAVVGRGLNRSVPPVMQAPHPVGRFCSILGPADMILLFDKPDRLNHDRNIQQATPNAYLEMVLAPTLADLIVAFSDEKIAPAMRTVRVDMDAKFRKRDPNTGNAGYFPYVSAGTHTLIFPERDVRKSAGFQLLVEIWDEYLLRGGNSSRELPPASRELWQEDRLDSHDSLVPMVFTRDGFMRGYVCKNVANNSFMQMVVTSAVAERLLLPHTSIFRNLFGNNSMVKRVLALIGIPSTARNVNVEQVAERLEQVIDRSIDRLDSCRTTQDVKAWREEYLGPGPLGNESGGKWIHHLEEADSIRGHREDFRTVLEDTVLAILNDADAKGRKLPYRLEFAQEVLRELERHVLRMVQGDERDATRPSLLTEYFSTQIREETNAREQVQRMEGPATRGDNFGGYVQANKRYAKKRKELIGKHLLEVLCSYFSKAIVNLLDELAFWQRTVQEQRQEIGKTQTQHERNRLEKAKIPVRTYLTDRPRDGFFKDGEFERGLYQKHREGALDTFRRDFFWENNGGEFDLVVPFGKEKSHRMKMEEIVERAITWAGTKRGNPDRPESIPPFKYLGDPNEINMAVRLRDYFGDQGAQSLTQRLSSDLYLASLCPLRNWPRHRLMYTLGLPIRAEEHHHTERFYAEVQTSINAATGNGQFDERRPMIWDPENPRHAIAAEFAIGFKLEHRTDYASYAEAYRNDTNRFFALHCLPEEDRASTYYEVEFRRDSEIYKEMGLTSLSLDPAVVDILGNPKRLELFVKALMVQAIAQLPKEQRSTEGADYYIWPRATGVQRIRLSRMNTITEINTIATDLAAMVTEVQRISEDTAIVNRLRLMYALRSFILLESDVDRPTDRIDYDRIERDVERLIAGLDLDARVTGYSEWKQWFLDTLYHAYQDRYPMLAHLGLVLARVAHDLALAEAKRGE